MKKINLAISGCLGRMGQQLIKSSRSNKNFKLVALTENKTFNKKIAGIKINLNTNEASFVLRLIFIPAIFLLKVLFSVSATNLKFLFDLEDLMSC